MLLEAEKRKPFSSCQDLFSTGAEARQSVCSCSSEVARRSSVRGHQLPSCLLKRMEELVTGQIPKLSLGAEHVSRTAKSTCTIHGCWRGRKSVEKTVYTSWRVVISWCFPSVNPKVCNSILSVLSLKRSKPKHTGSANNIHSSSFETEGLEHRLVYAWEHFRIVCACALCVIKCVCLHREQLEAGRERFVTAYWTGSVLNCVWNRKLSELAAFLPVCTV